MPFFAPACPGDALGAWQPTSGLSMRQSAPRGKLVCVATTPLSGSKRNILARFRGGSSHGPVCPVAGPWSNETRRLARLPAGGKNAPGKAVGEWGPRSAAHQVNTIGDRHVSSSARFSRHRTRRHDSLRRAPHSWLAISVSPGTPANGPVLAWLATHSGQKRAQPLETRESVE
jgi:hypothetical protein